MGLPVVSMSDQHTIKKDEAAARGSAGRRLVTWEKVCNIMLIEKCI